MQSNILTRSNPFYIHRGLRISDGSNKILSSFLFRGRWWNHCGGIRTSKSDALQLMSDVWRWLLVYSVCGLQFAECAVFGFSFGRHVCFDCNCFAIRGVYQSKTHLVARRSNGDAFLKSQERVCFGFGHARSNSKSSSFSWMPQRRLNGLGKGYRLLWHRSRGLTQSHQSTKSTLRSTTKKAISLNFRYTQSLIELTISSSYTKTVIARTRYRGRIRMQYRYIARRFLSHFPTINLGMMALVVVIK